jgi:RNA polymerase sigma-70 factor, ECF subfamily
MDVDQETIKQILAGDYKAFEQIVEKYHGKVYRHLRKMVKDDLLAEDLLQDTFFRVYQGLNGFEGSSTFSTWLFKIATNSALMVLRKREPELVEFDEQVANSDGANHLGQSFALVNTPFEILLSAEGRKKIEDAIESLPVIYRSVIMLRDVEGFSTEEVSKILDSSVAAVKSRLHRARSMARDQLTSYYQSDNIDSNRRNLN